MMLLGFLCYISSC